MFIERDMSDPPRDNDHPLATEHAATGLHARTARDDPRPALQLGLQEYTWHTPAKRPARQPR
jgi:hypothetical protein